MYFFSPLRHITERDLIYSGTGPGDGSLRRESIQIAVPILATLEVDSIGHQHTWFIRLDRPLWPGHHYGRTEQSFRVSCWSFVKGLCVNYVTNKGKVCVKSALGESCCYATGAVKCAPDGYINQIDMFVNVFGLVQVFTRVLVVRELCSQSPFDMLCSSKFCLGLLDTARQIEVNICFCYGIPQQSIVQKLKSHANN